MDLYDQEHTHAELVCKQLWTTTSLLINTHDSDSRSTDKATNLWSHTHTERGRNMRDRERDRTRSEGGNGLGLGPVTFDTVNTITTTTPEAMADTPACLSFKPLDSWHFSYQDFDPFQVTSDLSEYTVSPFRTQAGLVLMPHFHQLGNGTFNTFGTFSEL